MASRTKLHIDLQTTGSLPDNRLASSFLKLTGGTMSGDINMGANNISISHIPLAATDVVNKAALDAAISGLDWRAPIDAFNLIGITGPDALNLYTPAVGEDWIILSGGTLTAGTPLAVNAGDVVEYKAAVGWILLTPGTGGFPSASVGTDAERYIIGGAGVTLSSPFVQGADNGKIIRFSGTTFAFIDTMEATNSAALLAMAFFFLGLVYRKTRKNLE